jgi:hypothetical protein
MTQVPIPIHIGSKPLDYWDDIEARQQEYGEEAAPWLREQGRPALASPSLDWNALGFAPRWVGFDTADCVAALQPSVYSGQGADEFDRFRQGAQGRGELALVVSTIGQIDAPDPLRRVLFSNDDSISLGRMESTISGSSLGQGARARAAEDLKDADAQLALRLLNCNPPLPWRALSLHGVTYESYDGRTHHPAQGTLEPIIVTELDEPVVAAWVSPDGVERRYVVPVETPWPVLLKWLIEYGLSEYVPGALRRARHPLATDQTLMTRRERASRAALADLDADYSGRHADLTRDLADAQAAASAVRDGLLYGTGTPLVDTVRFVLESAGITVFDLDTELGGTKNADLLCSYGGRSRLIEVKSASGSASERAYEDLVRHLREWERVLGSTPVEGGALVINHQHRTVPQDRSRKPYGRPEFLAAQVEPVISTLELFDAWREENSDAVVQLIFVDAARSPVPRGRKAAVDSGSESPPVPLRPQEGKRGWFRRRSPS